jgi:hypothetical protein
MAVRQLGSLPIRQLFGNRSIGLIGKYVKKTMKKMCILLYIRKALWSYFEIGNKLLKA